MDEQLYQWLKGSAGPDGAVANGLARAKVHLAAAGAHQVEAALATLQGLGRVQVDGKSVRAL